MYACKCVYVCMNVYTRICMYGCIYVCMYQCMYALSDDLYKVRYVMWCHSEAVLIPGCKPSLRVAVNHVALKSQTHGHRLSN
jgi:hypothetical protein